jgi:hypothetical protein
MRVNSRLLYWGVVLVAIGGVLVAADLRAIDTSTLTEALRLWPLAVVAVGLSIVLRKTRLSLPALLLAAALPGLVVGAAFAVAPRFVGDCGFRGEPVSISRTQGTFEGPATITVRTGCGTLNVSTAPGNAWHLDARTADAEQTPSIASSPRSLSIDGTTRHGNVFDVGREALDLTLPTSALDRLSMVVFAGKARVDLAGAQLRHLAVTANAAAVVIDASAASISDVSAVVNVGLLSIRLPAASDLTGSLRVGAGELRICAPPGLGLRITSSGTAGRLHVNDLKRDESEWQSPDYASAMHRADLRVHATFGAVEINPIGECS